MAQATRTVTIIGRTGTPAEITITASADIGAISYNADGDVVETGAVQLDERCEILIKVNGKIVAQDRRISPATAEAARDGAVARIGVINLMPDNAAIAQAAHDAVMAEITTPEIVAHKAMLADLKAKRDAAEEAYEAHAVLMARRMKGGE